MTKLELVTGYKRYLKNSALADKERNLVEDYTKMEKWLNGNATGDTSSNELIQMLCMDAVYRTITKAVNRNIKFKEIASFGSWDGQAVKKGTGYIPALKNASNVGDYDTYTIVNGQLTRLMQNLMEEGCDAARLYIFQAWMQQDSTIMRVFRKTHKEVEQILGLSTDEDIEAMLQSIFHSNDKKPSPAVTETNIDSAPEVSNEISKRAYEAYISGDVDEIRRCINDVTALYAKGYFNRHDMSEENAAAIFKGWVGAFKKYISRITDNEEEPYNDNPLGLIRVIVESSESTDENELTP